MSNQSPQIEDVLAKLRDKFVGELPSKIADMEEHVLILESSGADAETADILYRNVHSLKGSAGTYGLGILGQLAHFVEENLEKVRAGDNILVESDTNEILHYLDLMVEAIEVINEGDDDFSDIESRFGKWTGAADVVETADAVADEKTPEPVTDEPEPAALPEVVAKDGNPASQAAQPHLETHSTALIIDSSNTVLALCHKVLDGLPVRCVTENDTLQALKRLDSQKFDFVICESEPGIISGPALFAAVKLSGGANWNISCVLMDSLEMGETEADQFIDHTIVKDDNWMANLLDKMTRLVV